MELNNSKDNLSHASHDSRSNVLGDAPPDEQVAAQKMVTATETLPDPTISSISQSLPESTLGESNSHNAPLVLVQSRSHNFRSDENSAHGDGLDCEWDRIGLRFQDRLRENRLDDLALEKRFFKLMEVRPRIILA